MKTLQQDNRTPEQKELIRATDRIAYDYDTNPAVGGPIIEDKLWFFGAFQRKAFKNFSSDVFFAPEGSTSSTGADITYDHAGEQAFETRFYNSGLLRLTNQVTQNNKWRISFERVNTRHGFATVGSFGPARRNPPEASNEIYQPIGYHAQVRWTSSLSNRLLVEAGFASQYNNWRRHSQDSVGPLDIKTIELTTGQGGVASWLHGWQPEQRNSARASVSYITGSHNIKVGSTWTGGYIELDSAYPADTRTLFFFNGQGAAVDVLATPLGSFRGEINNDLGVFAQDSWTIGQLTLNLGVRYDHFNSQVPPQSAAAGTWVPARSFPAFPGPSWNDTVVRVGVAYDIFGDGRTALKGTFNQYVLNEGSNLTMLRNPMASETWAPNAEIRSWNDLDGNRSIIDKDTGRIQFEEVGPSPNENFGLASDTTVLDPDLKRQGNWEINVVLQHELFRGLSVSGGYYRRDYFNTHFTDNLAVDAVRDWSPFTIQGPVDPRLGRSGEVITQYNLNLDAFGRESLFIGNSSTNDHIYDGFEFTADGRLLNGAFFGGSVTTERNVLNVCDTDNPNDLRFCDKALRGTGPVSVTARVTPAFRTMFKAFGAYPLPGDVTLSTVIQGMPGRDRIAIMDYDSATAGVPLTGGGTRRVQLIEPGTLAMPYMTKVDLRVMRRFEVGGTQITPSLDIFNLFNASTVTDENDIYGPDWLRPITIFQGRFARIGMELEW